MILFSHRVKYDYVNSIVAIVILLTIFVIDLSYSQKKDTLSFKSDSLKIKSDSTLAQDDSSKTSGGIDAVVTYTAIDSIIFTFGNKQMKMFGKGDVKFKDLSLKSERIDVNWNTSELASYGVLDSVKAKVSDSLKTRYSGTPVMVEGTDKYEGWKISYNFKSQKGRVTLANTEEDQGYYQGQQIKKIDKDMLFISSGYYSTCEFGHPHFYFFSPEMRVTVRDKIVARPIYLYIADVPIFALPFGVFPSQGGRRSGIIAPAFVDKGSRGTGLEHFGYYFAMNDYMDMAVVGDWLTGGTYRASPNFRYIKRYDYSGSLSGYYQRTIENESHDPDFMDRADYYANLVHNQTFNPTTQMSVNFSFASSESFKRALTRNDYLNQEIISNATISKSWEGTSNSMSVNINRTQNLITGSITNTLPTISFNHSQSYPFRFGKQKNSSESSYSWYEMIGLNYGASAQRIDNKTRSIDTLPFVYDQRQGINHNLSFNIAPKAGYFTIAPSLSYNEKWYDRSLSFKGLDTSGNPILVDKYGFAAVRTFSTGVSISTRLYGMLNSPIPGLSGFRHTITPVVSYTYIPDFSEKQYGYYTRYIDKFGKEQKFDRFAKGVYGSASAYESQSIGMSVGNVFETKTSAKDTTEKEQKYQLLNLGASASYNFVADSLKFSQISTNFRTDIGSILGIGGSANFNLYEFDQTAKTRVNRYLLERGKGIAQLTYLSLSLSTSLRGEKKQPQTQQDVNDSARVADTQKNQNFSGYKGIYDTPEPDFSIPWSLSLSFNFSQSQENPQIKSRSANISGSLDFNLTENWKFTASSSYDIVTKQFAAPQMNISRDLHCWLMNFQWSPLGPYAGYRFEIKVKAPQLQDIKLTKQNNDRL